MLNKLGFGVALGVIVLACSPASAVTNVFPVGSPNFQLTSGTPFSQSITAVFFNTYATPTSFDDTYQFTIPQSGFGSGNLSTSFSGNLNKLVISALYINDVSYDLTTTSSGQTFTTNGIPIVAGALNTIRIVGSGAGIYSGNATFQAAAAVPEAGTWAMMLGGFGLMGAAMRRRRVSVKFA
jgi:hypothetical protein